MLDQTQMSLHLRVASDEFGNKLSAKVIDGTDIEDIVPEMFQ